MAWKELYYHSVDPNTMRQMATVRARFIELGEVIDTYVPDGKSKEIAKERLEDALMRSIQGIALTGELQEPGI